MKPRLNADQAAPEIMRAMGEFDDRVRQSGLEPLLLELVKTRASQLNGCAYCLHLHTAEARALGESEERLYLLDAWRESPLYSPRERAALAWTEALTLIARSHAPDEVYAEARRHFSEAELVKLSIAIGLINAWNRLAVGFRQVHPTTTRPAEQE